MILPIPILITLTLPALVIVGWLVVEWRAAQRAHSLKRSRRWNRGFADLLVYAALVRPDIVLNKDGALMAAFEFRGQDPTGLDYVELRRRVAQLNKLFLDRDAGWMFHVDLIRRAAAPLEAPSYVRSGAERTLIEERIAHATDRYVNRFLFAVTYLPQTDANTKRLNYIVEGDSKVEVSFERVFSKFVRGLDDIEDHFGAIGTIRRLGGRTAEDERGTPIEQNELLEALSDVIYGEQQSVTVPPTPIMLSGLLGSQDLIGGMQPRIGAKHIRVLNLAGFPPASYPGILNALQRVKGEFRFSTRIIIEDTHRARVVLDEAFRSWFGKRQSLAQKAFDGTGGTGRVNRDANNMADDAETALESADRGLVRYVYYTGKIVLLSDDVSEIQATVRELVKVFRTKGFPVREETVNAIDAYLGSLWGDGYHDVRKYMLHTVNAGDMLLSTSEWRGREVGDCRLCVSPVEPMFHARTRGRDDFAVDLHYQDIMHTAVLGATGAGKTTLLNTLIGNFARRPGDQIFALDYKYGMFTTGLFLGGEHIDPRGFTGSMRFGVFTYLDESGERAWLVEYLTTIAAVSGVAITPFHRELIDRALELMEATPPAYRSLSTFLQKLNDREGTLRLALTPYTVGGSLEGILDGHGDQMSDSPIQVFELSNILGGSEKERVAVPVVLLLLHWVERRLRENRRTIVPLDEAWAAIRSPIVQPQLDEMLRTYRKLHAGVVLATQNLDDIVDSPIATTMISACVNKILLPTPQASGPFRRFYRESLERNDAEIRAIAGATQRKEYYFTSLDGSAMIDLDLSRAELAVYARSSSEDIAEVRRLLARYPDTWREELLRARGCQEAADRLVELKRISERTALPLRPGLAIA